MFFRHLVVASLVLFAQNAFAQSPAWCPSADELKAARVYNQDQYQKVNDADETTAVESIVVASCHPAQVKHAKAVGEARAAWSKKLGMVDADWADAAAIVKNGKHILRGRKSDDFNWKEAFSDWNKRVAFSTLTPFQQYYGIKNKLPQGGSEMVDHLYLADTFGPKLSEMGKLALALPCLKDPIDWPLEVAICEHDVRAFNRVKFGEEIRAEKLDPEIKMNLRFLLLTFDERMPDFEKAIKKMKAEDKAYEKMFDIAAKTRTDWDQLWKTEAKTLEFALAMDDARETRSKKAHEGCSDPAWAAFKESVSQVPASKMVSTKEDDYSLFPIIVALSSPHAYLTAVALASCEGDSQDGLVSGLHSKLGSVPGMRGPRTATWQAISDAALSLDEQGKKINYGNPDQRGRFYAGDHQQKKDSNNYGFGTVAKIGKVDADGLVEVTFAKVTEKREACVESKTTNRISHWLPDGSPVYYHSCLKWGVKTEDKTPDPVKVLKRYIDGIKPGTTVLISDQTAWVVYPKGGKKTPVAVFGVPVK